MNFNKTSVSLGVAALLATGAALAQPADSGWYGGASVGRSAGPPAQAPSVSRPSAAPACRQTRREGNEGLGMQPS